MLYENRNLNGDCIKQHAFWEGRVPFEPTATVVRGEEGSDNTFGVAASFEEILEFG